ncbi:ImmA/IrrE family metallo-endopeptidase [Catellatospora sp. NPDC049609]|uniref:ImmA/IrrE family metallo-endopeptidase n=1 Tax=Catellatospora sp. NPDC049609 TaxID=3155505 RepID=UPI00342A5733
MAVLELPTDRRLHIERYARGALVAAQALGKTPTPLEDVTAALELHQPEDLYALGDEVPPSLLARFPKLMGKLLGALDVRRKTIYIDMSLEVPRRRFTHGHELGHEGLPWHRDAYYGEDKTTLRLDTLDELEAEANAFSAALLFNLDRFTEQAHSVQPSLAVPVDLADVYQASRHASIRRYVEAAHDDLALFTLGKYTNHPGGRTCMVVLQTLESATFRAKFGAIAGCVPSRIPIDSSEIARDAHSVLSGNPSGPIIAGQTVLDTPTRGRVRMDYEIYFNRRQFFVLVMPTKIRIFKQRINAGWA